MNKLFLLGCILCLTACTSNSKMKDNASENALKLTLAQANHLAQLPLKCMEQEYPNKLSQTLSSDADLESPKVLHPAFYGCFDWHSAVHGHWMLVKLLKLYPELENTELIIKQLQDHLSAENIQGELAYFQRSSEKSFERTYGWAWLLKLAEELHTWETPLAQELEANLQPLTDLIAHKYIDFLPRLQYPVRVGTHTNTAFGLTLAWDYALAVGNDDLLHVIEDRARSFYSDDKGCPIGWEPGGIDFLSPCLEEVDLMRRVLPKEEFSQWLGAFMPQLANPDFKLEPGKVVDASDGHLVHLYGLNLSRAWCLYGIAKSLDNYGHLFAIANKHMKYSLPHVVNGEYMGEHWLASFAIYALTENQ